MNVLRMLSGGALRQYEGISGVKKNRIKGSFFPFEYSQKTTGFIYVHKSTKSNQLLHS